MNIKTRWFRATIGRLPMYSGEPWGLWLGILPRGVSEHPRGHRHRPILFRKEVSLKVYV